MNRKRTNQSQIAGPSKRRNVENVMNIDRSGKITRIILKNFMCHSNLAVDFNQQTNLIVGNNGSGKSAILTALIIGLGCSSTTTSRCSSIKQLIKRGETQALIEIHIANHSEDGYDYDKYGDTIIVSRSFTAAGSSSYKIKNSNGNIMATTKSELLKIILYMNIQVDNPVCVLNQDASRSFLKESDPKKRFQLFLKATQIETIINKLNECTSHYKNARSSLEYSKKLTAKLKEQVDETQDKYNQLQSVGYLKEEVKKFKGEQSWLKVSDQENFVTEISTTLDQYKTKYDKLKEKYGNRTDTENQIKENARLILGELNVLRTNLNREIAREEEMRQNYITKKEIYQAHVRSMQKNDAKKHRLQNDIAQLERDILERSENHTSRVAKMKQANLNKLEELNVQKVEIQSMSDSAKRDIELLTNTRCQMEGEFNGMRDQRKAFIANVDKCTSQIRQCDASSKDKLQVYGNFMPRLVAAINVLYEKGAFNKLPRGPLGQYIDVEEEKWRAPIEGIIGGTMRSFFVNDRNDRAVLNKLIQKDYPEAKSLAIIMSQFCDELYDVSDGKVRAVRNSYCAMDLIKCDDTVVMNCLIDQCKIESILLVEEMSLATHLTAEEENVPRNLRKVILTNPNTEIFPAPMYRLYSTEQRHARYLQVNMAQRKAQLEADLDDWKEQHTAVEDELRVMKAKLIEISHKVKEKNSVQDKLDGQLRMVQSKISELEKIEYPAENEMEMLKNEMTELNRILDETNVQIANQTDHQVALKQSVTEKEHQLTEIKVRIREKESEMLVKQKHHDKQKQNLEEMVTNARYGEIQIQKLNDAMEKINKELTEANEKKDRLLVAAEKLCQRLVTEHTDEELSRKIKDVERKINTINRTNDTIEDVDELLKTKMAEHKHNMHLTNILEATLKNLYQAKHQSFKIVTNLKQHMSLRVQHLFNTIMKLRNYDGNLKINHQEQLLELSVVPRDKHIENAVSNAKCLSGGERSYSTIALLLSLWSCVESPFYFLDEYDVFTDQVNRLYMTKLLLSEATKKPHRQYVFLTPQDMSSITPANSLTIHKMANPEKET